ncbi:uroporphyrinogen-III synthase [Paracoccus spongiarum]|uniref:Uroporphyrinogen-III synthase n=1 Tax=Paracoccus spongiarum TaxID=3064387 RepID=A0ABT9JCC8_9RHOB|nr:uroporphyrinogen-III synthase [Paracoccus sp. 2205BS29-5]MDP5307467.1 uroporphyrinogen-III synthase [Paracoccus sp. 2205BS29-5]
MDRRAAPTLLLTRPEPDSGRLAALLPGMAALVSPILRIVPVAHDRARLDAAEGLVFTSGHAVAAAGAGRGRPAFCVGPRTAQLAGAAGFRVIEGPGDAEGLRDLVAGSALRLLHPHGRHLARDLPVEGVVVYDQIPQDLSPAALRLLAGAAPVVLPVMSPRSATLLAGMAGAARAPLWLAAISPAALEGWTGRQDRRTVAAAPRIEALAAAIGAMCGVEQS